MELELCDQELSVMLKKVGFYLNRTLHYTTINDGSIYFGNHKHLSDEEIKKHYLSGKFKDFDGNDVYIVETLELVKMWFREVHGIYVCVDIAIDGTWFYNLYNLKEKRCSEFKDTGGQDYKIYNQALSVGLKEACKLIKT